MTEIVITPPETISITATSPTAYTITVTQPAAVTVTAALGASGTVTSIATTAPITGGTITGAGTIGIDAATTAAAGSMSASDKTKLDGIEAGAEVNNISDGNATDLTDGGTTSLHTHSSYYTLQFGVSNGHNPVDSTTYYLGGGLVQSGTAARTRLYIPVSGTIIYAVFNSFVVTTLGSAETSSAWVRLNNTTDTLISNAIKQDANYEQFINSSLSIAVTAGDYIEIKWTTPAWTTNPTNTRQFGTIMVRV